VKGSADARGASVALCAGALAVLASIASCEGCMKRRPVASVPVHPYPSCDGQPLPEGEVVAEGTLRAGPTAIEKSTFERFRFERRGCVYVASVRQQWRYQVTDVEVVFDLNWRPLRAWKRMAIPGADLQEHPPDIRLYELRNQPPTMSRSGPDIEGVEHRVFNGTRPVAVVGPGRGLLSAWIWAQGRDLQVGEVVRGPVLDFRPFVEGIDVVALRRDPDRDEPSLGRVRVYTVFGRESIFTDEEGVVLGDLAGLRPAESVSGPPLPEVQVPPPDPVHTP